MHSFDRTLLAKLGFADGDRQEAMHDKAVQFLSMAGGQAACDLIAKRLERVSTKHALVKPELREFRDSETYSVTNHTGVAKYSHAVTEYHVVKGIGQYATTVGFVDAVLFGEIEEAGVRWHKKSDEGAPVSYWHNCQVPVEVKITPVPVGDVIRQIRVYHEYMFAYETLKYDADHPWLLVVNYAMSEADKAQLDEAGITVARLGAKFDEWLKQQTQISAEVDSL